MKRYLMDGWLALFVVLAALASVIAAHGSRVFFGYLVDPWLAWVFTAVLALGIVGLDAAATIEPIWWKRMLYLGGMLLFLAMETLGNYFAGQAVFVTRVRGALAASSGSDLLTIATTSPTASRGLVVLFLALASAAVAFFTFAAATRAKQLAHAEEATTAAQFQATVQALETQLAQAQADAARQATDQATALRERDAAIAQHEATAAQQATELAQTRAELDATKRHAAQQAESYAAGLRKQETEIARLREAAAQPIDPAVIDWLAVARTMREFDVPWRTTADLLRMPESTLRNQLKRTNGVHPVEA